MYLHTRFYEIYALFTTSFNLAENFEPDRKSARTLNVVVDCEDACDVLCPLLSLLTSVVVIVLLLCLCAADCTSYTYSSHAGSNHCL